MITLFHPDQIEKYFESISISSWLLSNRQHQLQKLETDTKEKNYDDDVDDDDDESSKLNTTIITTTTSSSFVMRPICDEEIRKLKQG